MLNLKKLSKKLEKAEDKTNTEEDLIRSILEYASYSDKVIDYNFFKDIPSEIILKAIEELTKVDQNQKSTILNDMIMAEYVKDNIQSFIPKSTSEDDLFF